MQSVPTVDALRPKTHSSGGGTTTIPSVSIASGLQQYPPWGLDRIDSLDNNYTFGAATGNGSVIYVLDTGVR
eukprot:2947026-Prymnesium_polylepis.1